MRDQVLETWETVVACSADPGAGRPGRIVIKNWRLASPSVPRLDLSTLLRQVDEAGITIERWAYAARKGLVTVSISAPRSRIQPRPPAMQTSLSLLTKEEANQLRLPEKE